MHQAHSATWQRARMLEHLEVNWRERLRCVATERLRLRIAQSQAEAESGCFSEDHPQDEVHYGSFHSAASAPACVNSVAAAGPPLLTTSSDSGRRSAVVVGTLAGLSSRNTTGNGIRRAAATAGSIATSARSLPSILEHHILGQKLEPTLIGPEARLPSPIADHSMWIHQDLLESAIIYMLGVSLLGLAFAFDEATLARRQ